MAVELWTTANTVPFVRGGSPLVRYETIGQQGGRAGDMLKNTVLGRVAIGGKWQQVAPGNADGTQWPAGILMRTITEAELIAGDIENVPIMTGGSPAVIIADGYLIFEDGVTPLLQINQPVGMHITVREAMAWANMYITDDQNIERAQEPVVPI